MRINVAKFYSFKSKLQKTRGDVRSKRSDADARERRSTKSHENAKHGLWFELLRVSSWIAFFCCPSMSLAISLVEPLFQQPGSICVPSKDNGAVLVIRVPGRRVSAAPLAGANADRRTCRRCAEMVVLVQSGLAFDRATQPGHRPPADRGKP
jgi:hypothetical protein